MKIRITSQAQDQYAEIVSYTQTYFGTSQADLYEKRMLRALETLMSFPESGYQVEDVEPGLRAVSVGRHRIFYQISEDAVEILAILHDSQLPHRHLDL